MVVCFSGVSCLQGAAEVMGAVIVAVHHWTPEMMAMPLFSWIRQSVAWFTMAAA
jgi:hypothetical protein